jgi:hypothetical protein
MSGEAAWSPADAVRASRSRSGGIQKIDWTGFCVLYFIDHFGNFLIKDSIPQVELHPTPETVTVR